MATAGKMEKALQSLAKKHKKYPPLSPLEKLAVTAISEEGDELEARTAVAKLLTKFTDWNDIRVARRAELAKNFDPLPEADDRAKLLQEMLNRLFDFCGSLDLSFLGEVKPLEGRKYLSDVDPKMPKPVLSSILFELCPGVTIPLSDEGLKAAKKLNLIGRGGTKQKLQKEMQEELPPEAAAHLLHYLELEGGGAAAVKKPTKKAVRKKKSK